MLPHTPASYLPTPFQEHLHGAIINRLMQNLRKLHKLGKKILDFIIEYYCRMSEKIQKYCHADLFYNQNSEKTILNAKMP